MEGMGEGEHGGSVEGGAKSSSEQAGDRSGVQAQNQGDRTSTHVCKQSTETQGWDDTIINERGGRPRPRRTWGTTRADAAFSVQEERHQQKVLPQDSVRAACGFKSDHWGSSDA